MDNLFSQRLSTLRSLDSIRWTWNARPVRWCIASLFMTGLSTRALVAQDGPTAESAAPDGLAIIFSGGLPGFLIVMLLFALSLTAVYLICEHLLTIRRNQLMPVGLDDEVSGLLRTGKLKAAQEKCREQPSFLSFVMLHGISEAEDGWTAVEKALEDASAEQAARLFRKIEFLSVIGNLAPMIGLLGTVTGMIIAFQQVAGSQGAAGAGELAEGIYQALVTTVGGLIVAIPSLAAFAFFRNRVDQYVAEASYLAHHACKPLKQIRFSKAPLAGKRDGSV